MINHNSETKLYHIFSLSVGLARANDANLFNFNFQTIYNKCNKCHITIIIINDDSLCLLIGCWCYKPKLWNYVYDPRL